MRGYVCLFVALLLANSPVARADFAPSTSQVTCAEQINECFNLSGADQSDCFYSSSKHAACTGSALANLAFKRWSLSPSTPGQDDTIAELMGPSSVDPQCVANCDSPFIAGLIAGQTSGDFSARISACYDRCIAEINPDTLRP